MSESPRSPKRRHILSSINAEEPRKRARTEEREDPRASPQAPPSKSHHDEPRKEQGQQDDESNTREPRRTRLKLKDQKPRRHRSRDRLSPTSSHRSRHHRHRRRHRSPTPPNPYDAPALDPDAAFRESLFDAMADDEGAAYWEGVYGQPVHVYASERDAGPAGELERMTDDEYAAHVRQRMWEKTHAGLLEERARREEARKEKKREERESRRLHEEMERSLRRGEERRLKRRWADGWAAYVRGWESWDGQPETLVWPLEGGRRGTISESDVRLFFIYGLRLEEVGKEAFVAKLKEERVRWHPDKMQQRLGGQVDAEVMKDVTAIFQIIDRLWGETRAKP